MQALPTSTRGCCPISGGGGGIRTHGPRERTPVFKTGAFNRSATPPGVRIARATYCKGRFRSSARYPNRVPGAKSRASATLAVDFWHLLAAASPGPIVYSAAGLAAVIAHPISASGDCAQVRAPLRPECRRKTCRLRQCARSPAASSATHSIPRRLSTSSRCSPWCCPPSCRRRPCWSTGPRRWIARLGVAMVALGVRVLATARD